MNRCRISGILKPTDDTFGTKHIYRLDIERAPDDKDSLIIMDEHGNLPEGSVTIEGTIRAEYFRKKGMLIYVDPDSIDLFGSGPSYTTVEGTVKNEVMLRKTKKGRDVCTLLLNTDSGPIPVILWGRSARNAPDMFKTGDRVHAQGRLQSRRYPIKGGGEGTTYEVSVGRDDPEVKKI